MLGAAGAVAAVHLQALAISCFEEGCLMACLWNLYTRLMDSRHSVMQRAHHEMAAELEAARLKEKLLGPVIEWQATTQDQITALQVKHRAASDELTMAKTERDEQFRCG